MGLENQNPDHPFSRRYQDLYNKPLKYYYSEAGLFFLYFYMLSGSIYSNYDIYNSQLYIRIKRKDDKQPQLAETRN